MFVITVLLILLMLAVFWWDATRFLIPNWLVGIVLLLYPIYVFLSSSPVDWVGGLTVFAIAFVIGLALFVTRIMGGGDVKLLAVCCLWVGKASILNYVIYTSLIGGALSLLLLLGRPALSYFWLRLFEEKPLPRLFEKGAPVPYGLAIAGGMLILLLRQQIQGLAL